MVLWPVHGRLHPAGVFVAAAATIVLQHYRPKHNGYSAISCYRAGQRQCRQVSAQRVKLVLCKLEIGTAVEVGGVNSYRGPRLAGQQVGLEVGVQKLLGEVFEKSVAIQAIVGCGLAAAGDRVDDVDLIQQAKRFSTPLDGRIA